MTKESAKKFSDLMTEWLLKAVDIQFKNEDDEYQQMADFFNENMPIDEEKLDELAHNHCLNHGYSNIDEEDYINDETLTFGDILKDIRGAYKAGYCKAMEEK